MATITNRLTDSRAAANSTYPKGGVSCSKDRFAVNQALVFQIKFCGKSPALRQAANRQDVKKPTFENFGGRNSFVTVTIYDLGDFNGGCFLGRYTVLAKLNA